MGISILSGAITTFGAGCFIFLCTVKPTQKIAVLITSTIGISFFVAMVLFGAIIHAVGPEDGCGDMLWFLKKKREPSITVEN